MEKLLHKKIIKIEIKDDKELIFITDTGEKISYQTFGDCCSSTWIAHVTGVKNLIGETVTSIKERTFSDDDQKKAEEEYKKNNEYDAESLALYGYLFETVKGTCDIDFRNESNGYYGGSLEESTVSSDYEGSELTQDF